MKNLIKMLAIVASLASVMFLSCKKNETKPSTPGILGNWKLVSDSSFVDAGNIPRTWQTYAGTASDHYNFQAGGKLSWYEKNGGSDSSTYSLRSADTVVIAYLPKNNPNYNPNLLDPYTIRVLTSTKMVLVLDGGPVVGDIMTFSR